MHSVGCYSCTGAPHSRLTVGCRDRGPGALGYLFSPQEFLSSGWILSHTPWPSVAPDSVILVTQGFGEQGVSLEVKGRGEGDSYHKYAGSLGCSELVNAIWYNMDPTGPHLKKAITWSYCIISILSLGQGNLVYLIPPSIQCQTYRRCLINNLLNQWNTESALQQGSHEQVKSVHTSWSGQDPDLLENHNIQVSGKQMFPFHWVALELFSGHGLFLKVSLVGSAFCSYKSPCDEWLFHLNPQEEFKAGEIRVQHRGEAVCARLVTDCAIIQGHF